MSICVVGWKAKKRSEISKCVREGHDAIALGGPRYLIYALVL